MSAGLVLLVLALAGLLGSVPFGLLIGRVWTGADVRRAGSGNIGATNVLRTSGPLPAALTLLLDTGKGAAAVLVARLALASVGIDPGASTLDEGAALAAVAGHMFSPWLGFQGGKGVATAAGALLVLSPALAALGFAVFSAIFGLTRIVSLGSLCACLLVPLVVASGLLRDAPSLPVVSAICALIVIRHRTNITRLLKGREPRLGSTSPQEPRSGVHPGEPGGRGRS